MTIRFLTAWGSYPANAIVSLDTATETSLVGKVATTDLTGGKIYVAPVQTPAPQPVYIDFTGALVKPDGSPVSGAGKYLGVVDSRGRFCNASSAGSKQLNSVTVHVAEDDMYSASALYSTMIMIGGHETAPGWDTDIGTSIEYPIGGARTPLPYGGAALGTSVNGSLIQADVVPLPVMIPKGATFLMHSFTTSAGGIVYNSIGGLNNGGLVSKGEAMQYGNGLANLTMTGTPGNSQNNVGFGPVAVLGYTSRPTFLVAGDSRAQGFGEGGVGASIAAMVCNFTGGMGNVVRSLGKAYGVINAGCNGETLANAAGAGYTVRSQLAKYVSAVIIEYGINDFRGGATAAATLANLATFAAKFSGKPIFACTVEPDSASTDGWSTAANQTPNATSSAARILYNDTLRQGGIQQLSGFVELADLSEDARNSGKWKVGRSANDCAITTGTTALTSTAAMQFTTADIGTSIAIAGAGAAGATLITVIVSVTSATACVVSTAASTTVAGATAVMTYTADGLHGSTRANRQIEASNAFDPVRVLAS